MVGGGASGGRGWHLHDAAHGRPGRRHTGPPTSRSKTPTRPRGGRASSAAQRSSAKPFDVLDTGRVAAIQDPTGAIVSLWQPRSRIGATLVNDVGALCWNELATTDLERARSFFADLLGWEYETDEVGYVSIMNAGRLNGGMRELAERERGIPPSWLPYFTVENAEDGARRAGQLGGRRLVPIAETRVGRFTVLADPQRAAFALFEGQTDP